jgi:peptidoglycan-associated lipoprotein
MEKKMKPGSFALLGLATILWTAGCSHPTKVTTAKPSEPTPVVAETKPAPLATRSTPAAPAATPTRTDTPRPATMTDKERIDLNTSLARLEDALFDYDKSTIRQDASTVLKADVTVIRDILASYPSQKLQIEGHCDERGSDEYNVALGDRRARAVQEFLVSMGVPNAQLTLISFGKERPVCTDGTEACWQKNRRAHVTAAL